MKDLLGSLPGVDMNDPKIQEAVGGKKDDKDKKMEIKRMIRIRKTVIRSSGVESTSRKYYFQG